MSTTIGHSIAAPPADQQHFNHADLAINDAEGLPTPGQLSSRQIKILVVEDNPVIQVVVKHMLTKMGHQVDVAPDGKSALQLFANDYQLILMDIDLPDTTGIVVTELIRTTAVGRRVPIVAMTSHREQTYIDQCYEVGMSGFSNKPEKAEDLEAIIEKYVMITA